MVGCGYAESDLLVDVNSVLGGGLLNMVTRAVIMLIISLGTALKSVIYAMLADVFPCMPPLQLVTLLRFKGCVHYKQPIIRIIKHRKDIYCFFCNHSIVNVEFDIDDADAEGLLLMRVAGY